MKRFIILLISLFACAILFLFFYLNSNHFKSKVIDKINQVTQGKLTFDGELHLSFYPVLGLSAHKIILKNAKDFGNKPFFQFEKVSFSVKLIPLLMGDIAPSKIIVYDGEINIIRNKQDKTNWQALLDHEKKENKKWSVVTLPKKLDIKNINLNFIDLKTNKTTRISNINFALKPTSIASIIQHEDQKNNTFTEVELEGKLDISAIKSEYLNLTAINAYFKGKRDDFVFSPLSAKLYGGGFNGSAGVKITQKQRNYFLKGSFQHINVEKLLTNILGYRRLVGTGQLTVNLTAQSIDPEKIMPSINGDLKFNIKNGNILGINFPSILNVGVSLIKTITIIPLIAQSQSHSNKTDFGSMSGSAIIRNGILTNKDLYILTKDIEATGQGKVDLVHQSIDYLIRLRPQGKTLIVNVSLSGPLGNPNIKVVKGSVVPTLLMKK